MVEKIKQHVLVNYPEKIFRPCKFKTIECSIMELADDNAYSTYDIEDAFKGGFLDPLSMVDAEYKLLFKIQQQSSIEKVYPLIS